MKKIYVVQRKSKVDETLEALRSFGKLHILSKDSKFGETLEQLSLKLNRIEKVTFIIDNYSKKADCSNPSDTINCDQTVDEVLTLDEQIKETQNRIIQINKEIERLQPLGSFHPKDFAFLEEKGIKGGLYLLDDDKIAHLPEGLFFESVLKTGNQNLLLILARELSLEIPFEAITLPEKSLSAFLEENEQLKQIIEENELKLSKYASYLNQIQSYQKDVENQFEFEKVRSDLGQEEELVYLTGYCPEKNLSDLEKASETFHFAYSFEKPEDPEEVPTLLENPKWMRIIQPVFDFMNTLPGYSEFDVSGLFLIALTLFFAMLIGDAGYGLIFLGLTGFMKIKFPKAPKEPFILFFIFSIALIIWGAITGIWFGSHYLHDMEFLNQFIYKPLDGFEGSQEFMIRLCFGIGLVHLTLAHLWQIIRLFPSITFLSQVGWLSMVWSLYFLAQNLVLGVPLPGFSNILLGVGFFLASAFSQPEKGWIKGTIIGALDLPLNVISAFADIVSYIRLFAVGYASLAVASSVNEMAANLGWNSLSKAIVFTLILFFGHGLNFVLGAMAVVVHGIRLNMLEFSGHLGMTWSGKKFEPFRKKNLPS